MGAGQQRSTQLQGQPSSAHPVVDRLSNTLGSSQFETTYAVPRRGQCAKPLEKSLLFKGKWCPEEARGLEP